MCDVCNVSGKDWKFSNGNKTSLEKTRLFHVYKQKVSVVKLCHIHAIELFRQGEKEFLRNHIEFCRELNDNQGKYAKSA